MYLQSIKSVKHNAAMSVNRSILKKSRHIGFGVFIVHSSMLSALRVELIRIQKIHKNCGIGKNTNWVFQLVKQGCKWTVVPVVLNSPYRYSNATLTLGPKWSIRKGPKHIRTYFYIYIFISHISLHNAALRYIRYVMHTFLIKFLFYLLDC